MNLQFDHSKTERIEDDSSPLLRKNRTYLKYACIAVAVAVAIFLIVFFVTFYAFGVSNSDPSTSNSLVVSTTSGPVEGFLLKYNDTSLGQGRTVSVKAWRGIPYAAPPVGTLNVSGDSILRTK